MKINKKTDFHHLIMFALCIIMGTLLVSCSTSQRAKRPIRYSRKNTKHVGWNPSTPQTTTYYIKKHSYRKRHNP